MILELSPDTQDLTQAQKVQILQRFINIFTKQSMRIQQVVLGHWLLTLLKVKINSFYSSASLSYEMVPKYVFFQILKINTDKRY